jgi:lysozyme family protein
MSVGGFPRAFEIVWEIENGGDRISDVTVAGDSGGRTIGGIALNRWPSLSANVVATWTKADFANWYQQTFWTPHACEQLPWPVDVAVYDGEVNEGSEGAMALQGALNVTQDGVIGPITLRAALAYPNAIELAALTLAHRDLAYVSNGGFMRFGVGWLKRTYIVAMKAFQ